MNTSQRNIIRLGCYALGGLSLLGALSAGLVGLVAAVVFVIVGKVVWAGRPLAQIASFGSDVTEVGRALEKAANTLGAPTPAPTTHSEAPKLASEEPAKVELSPIRCSQCRAENPGDEFNCRRCGYLMRSRHGQT